MERLGIFVSASTVSPHWSLRVGIVDRFNRPVVFIHAARAGCRFILTSKINFIYFRTKPIIAFVFI